MRRSKNLLNVECHKSRFRWLLLGMCETWFCPVALVWTVTFLHVIFNCAELSTMHYHPLVPLLCDHKRVAVDLTLGCWWNLLFQVSDIVRKLQTNRGSTTDCMGSFIAVGDMVTVTDGPAKSKQGDWQ